jgi:acyl-CoA thioester hydrolase
MGVVLHLPAIVLPPRANVGGRLAPMVARTEAWCKPVEMAFRSVQRVYFDDLDALNILHNVRYLLFIERARGELLNSLGFRWEDDLIKNPDKFHVVAGHEIQYLVPVRGEGEIAITLTPTRLGTSSFVLAAEVGSVDGATVYARGSTRLVRLDPHTARPCAWSDRFRHAFLPLLGPC